MSRLRWFAAAVVFIAAAAAHARPIRVALTEIEDDAAGVGKIVRGALTTSEIELVAGKRVARALTRLGADSVLDNDSLARLAAELEVDAVVRCEFDLRAHRLHVKIVALSKIAERFSVAARDIDSPRFRKAVRSTLLTRIAEVLGVVGAPDAPPGDAPELPADRSRRAAEITADVEDRPVRSKASKLGETAADAEDRPARSKPTRPDEPTAAVDRGAGASKLRKPAAADDAEVVAEDDVADAELREPPRKRPPRRRDAAAESEDDVAQPARAVKRRSAAPAEADAPAAPRAARRDDPPGELVVERRGLPGAIHSTNFAALRFEAGVSAVGRTLDFSSKRFAGAPLNYSNAPVPGARAAVEIYPGAFGAATGWLSGFGVAAEYEQALSLSLRTTGEMAVPLAITERSFSLGVRYRLAFGRRPSSPTLTFGVGYAGRTFEVDRSRLMTTASLDLPDVDYRMFDPGLVLRLAIGERVALTVGGRGLFVTSAGAIQRPDQYGAASVFGASAAVGVEIGFTDRIALEIAGEGTQLGLSFTGAGTLASKRDGDSSTVEVSGALDRYYGATAIVVVVY